MLEKELEEIGLNEKEAKIYLAALELGQSTVQEIAKKAGVNRATAYFVIEGLIKQGLISSYHKNKKQYFISEEPEKLRILLKNEENNLKAKINKYEGMIPQLKSLSLASKDKPVVRYYEGVEGLRAMIEEFLSKGDEKILDMIYSVDLVEKIFSKEEKQDARESRLSRDIKTRVLYTMEKGELKSTKDGARIKLPSDKYPITCDIALYNNKIRIASLGKKISGIMIEDKEIYKTLKTIFQLAWEAAEKYKK